MAAFLPQRETCDTLPDAWLPIDLVLSECTKASDLGVR